MNLGKVIQIMFTNLQGETRQGRAEYFKGVYTEGDRIHKENTEKQGIPVELPNKVFQPTEKRGG